MFTWNVTINRRNGKLAVWYRTSGRTLPVLNDVLEHTHDGETIRQRLSTYTKVVPA
jgi:hypothetical protein